jgi:hypothetical protein
MVSKAIQHTALQRLPAFRPALGGQAYGRLPLQQ